MKWPPDHVGPEAKPNGPRAKTTGRATKHPLLSKTTKPPHQTAKCLKPPTTSHAEVVAAIADVVDIEARGLETPNNGRIATIHHRWAAREGQWTIPKEPLSLTGMMRQNSGRRFQDTE
jgi:hypothetical protein